MQFWVQLYIDIWKIIPYLQTDPYLLKTKNINSLVFINTYQNNADDVFCFSSWKKRKELAVYWGFSPQN